MLFYDLSYHSPSLYALVSLVVKIDFLIINHKHKGQKDTKVLKSTNNLLLIKSLSK
jgi:hypothetical protein